jgi:hypothetical protein
LHEIDTPLGEGSDGNNGVKRIRVGVCILVKDLAGWAFFDCLNTIFENQGPKVANT